MKFTLLVFFPPFLAGEDQHVSCSDAQSSLQKGELKHKITLTSTVAVLICYIYNLSDAPDFRL